MTVEQFMTLEGPAKLQLLSGSQPIAQQEELNTCSHFLQLLHFYVEVTMSKTDPCSFGIHAFSEQHERFDVMLAALGVGAGTLQFKNA